ncbi:MAG: nitrous oxide reductase family maturation protein NosD [Deltaproteobacteria bacterium]|jgi:nitrous oxidase accessory protein|nr:nitrous oxide reductase family maturation protein NosD [Deltaproteobacteria bacterium]MCL5879959.1 nitrous oxide reductase family maturation protein NosD [Deltaproteobacteria bacterium]MDA8304360.1 nitrous oxide reductase family maturation protein NosD [Deltaproteobacteria bacterium]
MFKNHKIFINIFIDFLFLLFFLILQGTANSKTIYVGKDKPFHSIQNAVNSANNGNTIIVSNGEYSGNIYINKPLTLIGKNSPVINALLKGSGITVDAKNVTVKGFKIINTGNNLAKMDAGILLRQKARFAVIENNYVINSNSNGIYVDGAFFTTVKNNFITSSRKIQYGNRGYGIYLWNAQYGVFEENLIKYFVGGFYVVSSPNSYLLKNAIIHNYYGTHYMFSNHDIVAGNFVKDTVDGLALMYSRHILAVLNTVVNAKHKGFLFNQSYYDTIVSNVVIKSGKGMDLYNTVHCKIIHNLVINNKIGMHIWGGSFPNIVYNNSFINNIFQIKFLAHSDVYWDYKGKGNYWSDYNGFSMKKNNTGSLPYRSNSISSYIYWKYPIAKLLLSGSPVIQTLQFIENSFPIFTIPGIVDRYPYLNPTFPKKIMINSTKEGFFYVKTGIKQRMGK